MRSDSTQLRWVRQWSAHDVFFIIFSQWKIGVLFFALVMAIVTAYAFTMDDIFQSEAKLLVRLGRESVALDPTILANNIANITQSRLNEINSELEILQSAGVMERLIKDIGAAVVVPNASGEDDPEQLHEAAIEQLRENLTIWTDEYSNVIEVAYTHIDPTIAQQGLDKLIGIYLDKHIEVHHTTGSHEFLEEQERRFQEELEQADQKLQAFKEEIGVFSLEDQRKVLYAQISARQVQIEDTRREIASMGAKVRDLEAALAEMPQTVMLQQSMGSDNAAADKLRITLYDLRLAMNQLVSRFKKDTTEVRALKEQIALTKQLLNQEKTESLQTVKGLNSNRQQIELSLVEDLSMLAGLHKQVELLEDQVTASLRTLATWGEQEGALQRLERERNLKEKILHKYAESVEQARVDDALVQEKISNISIVQSPTLPISPSGPHRVWILVAGFFAASFGSLGLIFLRTFLDDRVRTPRDVDSKLGLPVLASFPQHHSLRVLPCRPRLIFLSVYSRIIEGLKDLQQRIVFGAHRLRQKDYRIIGVSSCRPKSGVTTVATNLALFMANEGNGDILLVDASLENPTITREYELTNKLGLSDILVNFSEAQWLTTEHPYVPGLYILAAGNATKQAAAQPPVLHDWTREAPAKRFDYIIVDLPVIRGSGFATSMAEFCDGVVLVVDSPRSRWQEIKRTAKELATVNDVVLGVVLNRREFPIPDWLYRRFL